MVNTEDVQNWDDYDIIWSGGGWIWEEVDSDDVLDDNFKAMFLLFCDKLYPVGSYYHTSDDSFNPNDKFVGKWKLVENQFLLGASSSYPIGSNGGEATHTLTKDEMPVHTHEQNSHTHTQKSHRHTLDGNDDTIAKGSNYCRPRNAGSATANKYYSSYSTPTINGTTATNKNTGGGLAHNNMPPYVAVNIWHRYE